MITMWSHFTFYSYLWILRKTKHLCFSSTWLSLKEGPVWYGLFLVWGRPLPGPEPVRSFTGSVSRGRGQKRQNSALWPAQATASTPIQTVIHQHHPTSHTGSHQLLSGKCYKVDACRKNKSFPPLVQMQNKTVEYMFLFGWNSDPTTVTLQKHLCIYVNMFRCSFCSLHCVSVFVGVVAAIWRQGAGPGCEPGVAADLWTKGFDTGTDRWSYHQTEPALQHHVTAADLVNNNHYSNNKPQE